ncbi:uncharacterized protein BDV17DRAFT_249904 [Aspergillus undulatus]|uniref:uncharacterized protein n=1 Tax=Aspergillus undulatus TaxID=1810928 RepID=UPI003CCE278C
MKSSSHQNGFVALLQSPRVYIAAPFRILILHLGCSLRKTIQSILRLLSQYSASQSNMSVSGSILITGGTAGIGYYCALSLARQYPNHTITIASRSDAQDAAGCINRHLNQTNVRFMRLDLSSLSQIRAFVETWAEDKSEKPPITHFLLNAGLQFPHELNYTENGFESTFGINHIGHALLFHLLTPHLARNARIVLTSSGTHDPAQKSGMPDAVYTSAEELAHPTDLSKGNPGRQRYSTSKLANVLWMYALERRLAELRRKRPGEGDCNWTVVAFDPGLVPGTGLAREYTPVMRFLWLRVLPRVLPLLRVLVSPNIHTAEESGGALAWLAADEKVQGVSGAYFEGRKGIKSSEDSYDRAKQEDLWEWTVRNVAKGPEEMARFELRN